VHYYGMIIKQHKIHEANVNMWSTHTLCSLQNWGAKFCCMSSGLNGAICRISNAQSQYTAQRVTGNRRHGVALLWTTGC